MRLAELLADISYTATNFQDVTVTAVSYTHLRAHET